MTELWIGLLIGASARLLDVAMFRALYRGLDQIGLELLAEREREEEKKGRTE